MSGLATSDDVLRVLRTSTDYRGPAPLYRVFLGTQLGNQHRFLRLFYRNLPPLETDPHPRHPKIVTGRGDKGDSGSAPKSLACVLGEPRPRSGVTGASASPITFGRTDGELVGELVVELVGH
jgi:hypothetical protein